MAEYDWENHLRKFEGLPCDRFKLRRRSEDPITSYLGMRSRETRIYDRVFSSPLLPVRYTTMTIPLMVILPRF